MPASASPVSRLTPTSLTHIRSFAATAHRSRYSDVSRHCSCNSFLRHIPQCRPQSNWAAAAVAAQQVSGDAKLDYGSPTKADPLQAVAKELKFMSKNLRKLIGSGHPVLHRVAKYYTQSEGKHVRPMLVLLISRATATLGRDQSSRDRSGGGADLVDTPISPSAVLADSGSILSSSTPDMTPLTSHTHDAAYAAEDSDILPAQRRLAEIVELIHTASLMHDDVIDDSQSRRSLSSANVAFGNKMAIMAGDFLLGRASIALARLRHPEVIELMATTIANLIEGEFMQLKNTALDEENPRFSDEAVQYYLQKTYLKSASLISKSCRSAALLGDCDSTAVDAAYAYGKNLGLAFQLVDDILDFTITAEELGKPAGADLQLGLATAPLLFAWKERPELGQLVGRKFKKEGDVQKAREIVLSSSGLDQARALAEAYVDKAMAAVDVFPDSDAKQGLRDACANVLRRRKIPLDKRLRRAILQGDILIVKRIVQNHPEVLQNLDYSDKANSSLHLAAKVGDLKIVRFLVESGHEKNGVSRNTEWFTPLMLAVEAGKPDVARYLIEICPQCVPWKSKRGKDALMIACRCSPSVSIIPLLLAHHPSLPHSHDADGNTPLHHASAAGELMALRLLLQAGANPNAQNALSWTPISYSATVAAEVYFKNLIGEVERWRSGSGSGSDIGGPPPSISGSRRPGTPTMQGVGVPGAAASPPSGPSGIDSATGTGQLPARRPPIAGGVRLVTDDSMNLRDAMPLPPPPGSQADWSPVDQRRAQTPTAGRSEWIGGEKITKVRASSGDLGRG